MTLAIRLEPQLEKRLAHLAELTGRTKSYYVREALLRTLEDIEDYYTALYRLEHPSGSYRTMEQVKHDLGLANTVGSRRRKKSKKTGSRSSKTHHPLS